MDTDSTTAAAISRSALSFCSVGDAWFEGGRANVLSLSRSQRSFAQKSKVNTVVSYWLDGDDQENVLSSFPVPVKNIKATVRRSEGGIVAMLVEVPGKEGSKAEQRVQVFKEGVLVTDEDVSTVVKSFSPSAFFQRCQISSDGRKVVFVGEPAGGDVVDFCSEKIINGKGEGEVLKKAPEPKFEWRDHMGEQLDTTILPQIFCLDVAERNCTCLSAGMKEKGTACGQPCLAEDGTVYFVGWPEETPTLRLGLLYCINRASTIFKTTTDKTGQIEVVTDEYAATSPIVSPDGHTLLYQVAREEPFHNYAVELKEKSIEGGNEESTLVPVVDNASQGEFPGLFITRDRLLSEPFLGESWVVAETAWHCEKAVIAIRRCDGNIRRLFSSRIGAGSISILARAEIEKKRRYRFALKHSTPLSPGIIFVCDVVVDGDNIQEERLLKVADLGGEAAVDGEWCTLWTHIEREDVKESCYDVQSLLIQPRERNSSDPLPCVVMAHGGPHSAYPAEFVPFTAAFVKAGFAVVATNFRGSVGYGQEFVRSLPKHCGDLDVNDVLFVATQLVEEGKIDKEKLVLCGGSHGGFITLHAIGQHPSMFKAAIARNPVTCIPQMVGVTDIWDWCFVEAGLPFSKNSVLDAEGADAMFRASPVHYVKNVETPTLLLIGGKDKRVPSSQGLSYYRALRAAG